eukprot:jgi/Mesvir1/8656/Mv02599-RA.1
MIPVAQAAYTHIYCRLQLAPSSLSRIRQPRTRWKSACRYHVMTSCSSDHGATESRRKPTIVGLTGSIGMGKSTVASMFRDLGVPVADADAAVHALYAKGGAAVGPVGALFPSAIVDGQVSRPALGALVLADTAALKRLESIVHPLVRDERKAFVERERERGTPLVVLDIPLLFETGCEGEVDLIAVVSASAEKQRERVLARPGMTLEKFESILAKQLPDAHKRRRAGAVIDTSVSLDDTRAQVAALVAKLQGVVAAS